MRPLLFAALTCFSSCYQPVFERLLVVDGGLITDPLPLSDAGLDHDAGHFTDAGVDAGGIDAGPSFVLHAQLPMRPRAIWSTGRQVWVVGDSNAVFRFDGHDWASAAPASGAGVAWTGVRGDLEAGDGSLVWALGEDASGPVLYDPATNQLRRVTLGGMRLTAPKLIEARYDRIWVGGAEAGMGALWSTANRGIDWAREPLPECEVIIGGQDLPYGREPAVLTADAKFLLHVWAGDEQLWRLTTPLSTQPPTGALFLWLGRPGTGGGQTLEGLFAGPSALLRWDGVYGLGLVAEAEPMPGGTPFAAVSIHGYAADDIWAIGDHRVVHRLDDTPRVTVTQLPGSALVAVHGAFAADLWVAAEDGAIFHRGP